MQEQDFLNELRAAFQVEAEEHVQAITLGLLELEKRPLKAEQERILETVFRAAHSLKGAARAVDCPVIETQCQALEGVFAAWKRQETIPPDDVAAQGGLRTSPEDLDGLHRRLEAIRSALKSPGEPRAHGRAEPTAAAEGAPETVRIAVEKLDSRLLESEELLTAKLTAAQRVADFREVTQRLGEWRKAWAAAEADIRGLRLARDRAQISGGAGPSVNLTGLLDFFDWSLDYLTAVEARVATLGQVAERDRLAVGKLVDELLLDSKQLLMLPFATLSAAFPRLVRELCRDQGKEAHFAVQGGEIEIDKRILEEMKDPLVHLLRNCVDHGIEPAAEREGRGKAPRASIQIQVKQLDGGKVELLVSDDGGGIDTQKVKASAARLALIAPDEAHGLGEAEAHELIFQSEVTTSPMVTQVSGRGLGLAIVREKAGKLGGEVTVASSPGLGTTFRIVLPATRALFRGILVEAGGQPWIVPTSQVERLVRVPPGDIQTIEGRASISYDGKMLALVPLAQVLERPPAEADSAPFTGTPALVLGTGDHRIAFQVDRVLDELEVLVKPLRKPLSRVRHVAAATVLGSGQVVPILNVADLLKSARRAGGAEPRREAKPAKAAARSMLVVEDSITSRMLLKGILESAGHRVKTAVDGIEAFTMLRAEGFDLVVSDVEMPRMNGFDLTARIRADKKLAELPVVLVTALETREDRERGIEVGANAYLVKSSFDQSNLLETIRRLV